ncbi:hypothetical protein LAJ19_20545 (plasmid) [Deinococcus taeanensis]|uniref:hypothetical protein n=1 Tax=Deinococcus taeanensis TaxID=2737050 RepID=UPI001CDC86EE|nr:hypothetical protein [Deinococcus taeanensis]UBV45200.1 hypothetical protein LAJ19_20545 [Deinococcus taeanensis]
MHDDNDGQRIITVHDLSDQELADRMGEADLEEAGALRLILEEEYPDAHLADIPEATWLKLLDRAVIDAKGSLENGSNMS